MAKIITIPYKGTDYVLEYTADSVRSLEKKGFNIQDVPAKPMTCLPALFRGAFLEHHRFLREEVIDEIYDTLGDKMGLVEKLAEMYNDPIEKLLKDAEDKKPGNPGWGADW